MNKVKTIDALEFAKIQRDEYKQAAEFTLNLNRELLDKSAKSIWCRWFKMQPEGLSIWDLGWSDVRIAWKWQECVDMLEYHHSLGHEEVEPPFTRALDAFYEWTKETGKA